MLKLPVIILTPTKRATMSIDIKATTFVFPHEILTPIVGKPTHETVKLLRKEAYANAYENECTLGGGDNGYLGLIMPANEYRDIQIKAGTAVASDFIKQTGMGTRGVEGLFDFNLKRKVISIK